jgi:hypothetical protein
MKIQKHFCCLVIILMLTVSVSSTRAGGSFAYKDILPILAQEPVMDKFINDGLEFNDSGSAMRIGQNVNPRFGGRRVGPYVIMAKPKGTSGSFTLEVTVETELICQDDSGNTVDVSEAQIIKEKFSAISIRPYKSIQPYPSYRQFK